MLSTLKLKIDTNSKDIGYNSGSLFQGIIMENIEVEYAEKLHNLKINPYSQYVNRTKDGTYWNISTTNKEAYEKIICPILELDKFFINDKGIELKILEKNLNTVKRDDFIEKNLFENFDSRELTFNFLTPTAFRRDNRYIFLPEPALIFQNLIRKFDSTGEEEMFSYELLREIDDSVNISKYNLSSRLFYLEKTKIPGFVGSVSLKSHTNKEILKILNLLNKFSEFSGTGIKSSMGMGGTRAGGERLGWKKIKIDISCNAKGFRGRHIFFRK